MVQSTRDEGPFVCYVPHETRAHPIEVPGQPLTDGDMVITTCPDKSEKLSVLVTATKRGFYMNKMFTFYCFFSLILPQFKA